MAESHVWSFDPVRAAAEDAADLKWDADVGEACAKAAMQEGGDCDDIASVMDSLAKALPPKPNGYDDRRQWCNRCGGRMELSEEFDAYYCGQCNRWVESKCGDATCRFCSKRPERPR